MGQCLRWAIDQLAQDQRTDRYPAAAGATFTSLMRHFVLALSITALSLGMSAGSAERALIVGASTTHTLTAREARALAGTVDIAVVTVRTDLHLHPAAATLVEPIGRLLEQPHAPPPEGTGQRPGGEA